MSTAPSEAVADPAAESLRAFDLHLRAGQLAEAEKALRTGLESSPRDPRVRRGLAQLLSSLGRRQEAAEQLRVLARFSELTPRELLSLVDQSGPFELISFAEILPADSKPAVAGRGLKLGAARYQYFADDDSEAALETTLRLREVAPDDPAVAAFQGRLIAENFDSARFQSWLESLPPGTEQESEYWLAIGTWLGRQEQHREAIRAYGEALRRDPTARGALRGMSASLDAIGEVEKATEVSEGLAALDKIFRMAAQADAEDAFWIAGELGRLGRHWESLGWYRHAFELSGAPPQRAAELDRRRRQISDWQQNAGDEEVRGLRLKKLVGFDIETFPLPTAEQIATLKSESNGKPVSEPLRLVDIASEIGLRTTFVSDYPLDSTDFYLYQSNGGGLGIIDFDLDGRSDLYVAQSGGDPKRPGSSTANQLFRQLPDGSFQEVTESSATGDRRFAQGICAGDINQDGFTDLLVANIGPNTVYLNQGDGTFVDATGALSENDFRWTSSLAMGDLDGDALPEIVEVNYLDDPLIYQRRCEGKNLACTPQRFRAASDRIFHAAGDGRFSVWQGAERIDQLPNYGFGAVIANFDGRFGNDVFVSNDGDVNHFWRSLPNQSGSGYVLAETATVSGCHVGQSGSAQACMGIAAGDFDRSGTLDLLVTNFHNEPVNLFLLSGSGFFVDQARSYDLVGPTREMLGFGTQAADFDNDGWLDAAILNGHIYDARYAGVPFRMTPQLFRGSEDALMLQPGGVGGPYWEREQLGRTLAKWDYDRDGQIDLVANHLDEPIAILHNRGESGNWLQIELVGVESERSAVGATVEVEAAGQSWTEWQTGGDGYMCTNEPLLHFGLGSLEQIDRVTIQWPSGFVQTLAGLSPNQRYLIVEGQHPVRRLPIQPESD